MAAVCINFKLKNEVSYGTSKLKLLTKWCNYRVLRRLELVNLFPETVNKENGDEIPFRNCLVLIWNSYMPYYLLEELIWISRLETQSKTEVKMLRTACTSIKANAVKCLSILHAWFLLDEKFGFPNYHQARCVQLMGNEIPLVLNYSLIPFHLQSHWCL